MTFSRPKITICICLLSVVVLVFYYFFENRNKPKMSNEMHKKASHHDGLSVTARSTENIQVDDHVTAQPATVNQDKEVSLADGHLVSEWLKGLGISLEMTETYKTYSDKMIRELALQGDIYALQEGAGRAVLNGEMKKSHLMRTDAATRGSIQALRSIGVALRFAVQGLENGDFTEQEISDAYGLKTGEGAPPIKAALYRSATAHYLIAAKLGDPSTAELHLKYLQEEWFGRPFNDREWRTAISDANALYQNFEKIQDQRGLNHFDHSFPKEYQKIFAYNGDLDFLHKIGRANSDSE